MLATREDIYVDIGLVSEAYQVDGFACVLLDRLESDWKERLMKDPNATPIEMLLQHFAAEPLPAPVTPTQPDIDAVGAKIQQQLENSNPSKLFRMLYDMLF